MEALQEAWENLDSTESYKNSMRKSIGDLVSDWGEFQKHSELTQKRFEDYIVEFESREKNLNSIQESMRQSSEEWKVMRQRLEERVKEFEDKEKCLVLLEEKRIMELALKEEKEGELNREKLVDKLSEKEAELNEKEIFLNGLSEKLESEKNALAVLEKSVEEWLREVELKEERVDERKKAIELIEYGISKRVNELDDRERNIKEREKKVGFELFDSLRVDRERLIDMKEKEVSFIAEDLELKEKEINILLTSNGKRAKELDKREKQIEVKKKNLEKSQEYTKELQLNLKKCLEEKEKLERGNKELELRKKELEDSVKSLIEVGVSEKKLEAKWKEFEAAEKSLNECQLKRKQCQSEKELLEDEIKELNVKRKDLEDRIKSIEELEEVRGKQLEAKWKESEEAAQERLEECQLKEKQLLTEKELLEKGNKELQLKLKDFEGWIKAFEIKELEVKRKDLEDRIKAVRELVVWEKQLEAKQRELEEVEQERLKEWQLKEKQCQYENKLLEKGNKELELKMKEFEDRIKGFEIREKEFEVKEKKLNDRLHARGPSKKVVDESCSGNSSPPAFTLAVELDGSNVHMSLNGLKIDLSSKDEVFDALQLSGDPVYVVLKAIEALYPPYLMKADMRFEGTVAKSCIFLLEQLIGTSPKIQPHQREHALKLAREWKAMMSTDNSLDVLGFLYLLASFDLASAFDTKEVIILLGTAAGHQQVPELCRLLGLRDKIPGVIRRILKDNNHRLQAIGLICTFELVDQFPPVPILQDYLKYFKRIAKAMAKNIERKNEAIDLRIGAAKAVIRCIVNHKLESQYSPTFLETSIQQLLSQKVHKKCSESVVHYKALDHREVEGREIPSGSGSDRNLQAHHQKEADEEDIPSACLPNCLKGHKIDPELSNTDIGCSHPIALILANMEGKSLLSFLDLHLADHQLLQHEVSTALRISDNSAKLVLDVVEGFCGSSRVQDSTSCIFLLEQLMRISPLVLEDVKETARRIASDWKAKLMSEFGSPLVIFAFLLFISVFRLVSAFDSIELVQLYKIVAEHKSVPWISETTYGLVYSQLENQQIEAEDLQQEIKSSATWTTVPENAVESTSSNANMESEEHVLLCSQIPRFIQDSSDPAELVLDALDLSGHFFDSQNSKISVVKSFYYLLKQLMNVTPKISPEVRGRALNLAQGWKLKLTSSNSCEALAFLLLLGVYGLSSSFSAKYLIGLLQDSSQLIKEASHLIRILGLEKRVPGFIMNLVNKKQRLLAFEYVYEFNLVDKIPPVALLKKHVLHSKMLAQEMFEDAEATLEARERAVCDEISALEDVMKCIVDRGLQSEYSPDELRGRVADLESLRAKLLSCLHQDGGEQCGSGNTQAEAGQEDTRKRPASECPPLSSPSKKLRRASSSACVPPPPPPPQYSSHANQAARHFGWPYNRRRRMVHSGYFLDQCGWPPGHLEPIWLFY